MLPSSTEIICKLGFGDHLIGISHECDYPKDLSNIVKLTEPKIRVDGTSKEIHQQIEAILEKSLSVYKVNVEKLKNLE